jgi:hypothetical protein
MQRWSLSADEFRDALPQCGTMPTKTVAPSKSSDEFVCVLRCAFRPGGSLDAFVDKLGWNPDVIWTAGSRGAGGRLQDHDGMNLPVAEGDDWQEVLALVRRRLRKLSRIIKRAKATGAAFELDVGVMPGGGRFFTRSVRLDPEELGAFMDLGVGLCVTSYPPTLAKDPKPARTRRRRTRTAAR